jgi:hypothetical protein
MKKPNFMTKDLHDNDWIGIIENNKDTLFAGRAQIRVFRLFDDIESSMLPWAIPINSTVMGENGGGSLSVPKIGMLVRVQFNNGDISAPEYTSIQNVDSTLIEAIKEDYDGTHVMLYDPEQELSVVFQKSSGFKIFLKESFIQISQDSMITIQHANSDSLIQLEGENCNVVTKNKINISAGSTVTVNADEVVAAGNQTTKLGPTGYNHAVLGEPLIALLSTLATAIDAKMPSTPGVNAGLVQQTKQAMLSKNVLIGK